MLLLLLVAHIDLQHQMAVILMCMNLCADIYNACINLGYIESQNHLQLKCLGLDKEIFEIKEMLPAFYDATNDYIGSQMIATNFDYVHFFVGNDGKKLIKKCKKLIKMIEDL